MTCKIQSYHSYFYQINTGHLHDYRTHTHTRRFIIDNSHLELLTQFAQDAGYFVEELVDSSTCCLGSLLADSLLVNLRI